MMPVPNPHNNGNSIAYPNDETDRMNKIHRVFNLVNLVHPAETSKAISRSGAAVAENDKTFSLSQKRQEQETDWILKTCLVFKIL